MHTIIIIIIIISAREYTYHIRKYSSTLYNDYTDCYSNYNYTATLYCDSGLRLNLSYTFDLTQATILGYHDNYVDVYSNSWGPMETGFSVDGPEYLTKETLKIETEQV